MSEGWNWSVSDTNPNLQTYPNENNYEKYKGRSYQIHVREVMTDEGVEFTNESMIDACGIKLDRVTRALDLAKEIIKYIAERPALNGEFIQLKAREWIEDIEKGSKPV